MAKTNRSLSRASKRRILLAQQKRLEKQLSQVSAKLEECMTCDTRALRSELSKIDADADSHRQALIRRLGLTPAQAAELMSSRAASGKKTAKKKASKKASSKKVAKKTGKRRSKKAGSKKRSKKG
jgi:hypothetical protein